MTQCISRDDIANMEKLYRANFINSLSGIKSANLVGTQNGQGVNNLCIVSSVFHVGANPPLVGMLMRPHTVPRDTLQNLKDNGVYTINHVQSNIVEQSHQTSARYPEDISEFTEVGLTPWFSETCRAPFVKESHIKMALAVKEIQLLSINNTELVIGEITEVHLDERYINNDGYVDIEMADSVGVSCLDRYHSLNHLCRLSYAKPSVQLKNS